MQNIGDGLAVTEEKDWIVAVPFCVPGERVLARVYRNVRWALLSLFQHSKPIALQDRVHSYADLVKIIRRSEDKENWRDDSRIQCKYFGKCSGCQVRVPSNSERDPG